MQILLINSGLLSAFILPFSAGGFAKRFDENISEPNTNSSLSEIIAWNAYNLFKSMDDFDPMDIIFLDI